MITVRGLRPGAQPISSAVHMGRIDQDEFGVSGLWGKIPLKYLHKIQINTNTYIYIYYYTGHRYIQR